MWAVFRKHRKFLKNCLLILIVFFVLIQLKSSSFGGYYQWKKASFKVQFYQIRHYARIFDYLKSVNVVPVVLDPNMLSYGDINEKFITLGVFENQTFALKKALAKVKLPDTWTYEEHQQVDYRILSVIKVKSFVSAHYTFSSPEAGILHLAVIFPRSNNYYWISEFTDHTFGAINFSIPLPMAVEPFDCTSYNVSDRHTFCIPDRRNHYIWQLKYAKFLECHYEDVVWKFEREYPLEKIDTRNHALGMGEMMRIARKFEVPIWISYGSLLGWYRQCDYIVHSKDMDTAMFAQDFSYEMFRELWFSPLLRMYVRLGNEQEGLEFRFFAAATVWFDLFMVYPRGEYFNTYMIHTILQELHRSTYPMLREICSADLLGVLVYLPCDPLKYILTEYGPDNWFTHKSWQYLNIDVVHHWNDTDIMYSNLHNYKADCPNPTIDHGCDEVPPNEKLNLYMAVKTVINTTNEYGLHRAWNL